MVETAGTCPAFRHTALGNAAPLAGASRSTSRHQHRAVITRRQDWSWRHQGFRPLPAWPDLSASACRRNEEGGVCHPMRDACPRWRVSPWCSPGALRGSHSDHPLACLARRDIILPSSASSEAHPCAAFVNGSQTWSTWLLDQSRLLQPAARAKRMADTIHDAAQPGVLTASDLLATPLPSSKMR